MSPNNAKKGLEVRIKSDISRTVSALNANPEMERMAGNGQSYKIQSTTQHSRHGTVIKINEYSWLPVDIIDMSEGYTQPVSVAGKKVTFDPCEI